MEFSEWKRIGPYFFKYFWEVWISGVLIEVTVCYQKGYYCTSPDFSASCFKELFNVADFKIQSAEEINIFH